MQLELHLRCDLHPRDTVHDEFGGHDGLRLADVLRTMLASSVHDVQGKWSNIPEEELAVEITDVNGIHVYDVNILETRQRQVCQDLAAQATSADHKNLAFISQKILYLLIA